MTTPQDKVDITDAADASEGSVRYEKVCDAGGFCVVRVKAHQDNNVEAETTQDQEQSTESEVDTTTHFRRRPDRSRKRHEKARIRLNVDETKISVEEELQRSRRLKKLIDSGQDLLEF
jgi:hypothetical protein